MILHDEKKAAHLLNLGQLVAIPTETVYGLAASIAFPKSIARIFEVKQRPEFDPLILHFAHVSQMDPYIALEALSKKRFEKLSTLWPGALTLVVQKKPSVPDLVTSGLPSVGIRIPNHALTLRVLKSTGPLAAPSANPFNYISPTTAAHVEKMLGEKIDAILDGGPSAVGVESTIIDITGPSVVLLRPGGITQEKLEQTLGEPIFATASQHILAPGQTQNHYQPKTPLYFFDPQNPKPHTHKGFLAFQTPKPAKHCEVLSPTGDLREAAANLFSALHKLDEKNLECIEVEKIPEEGLGITLMNRLKKAVHK